MMGGGGGSLLPQALHHCSCRTNCLDHFNFIMLVFMKREMVLVWLGLRLIFLEGGMDSVDSA